MVLKKEVSVNGHLFFCTPFCHKYSKQNFSGSNLPLLAHPLAPLVPACTKYAD